MNDYGRRYLIEKLRGGHDERRGGRGGNSRRGDRRDNRDNGSDYDEDYYDEDYYDEEDYYGEADSRRGVRGSGRGRRDRADRADMHSSKMKLTKSDINYWKHNMQNTDGTTGEHFDMQQVVHAAEKLGVKFRDYDEREFCLAVNMIYSDYGHIIKKLAPDKDLLICADFAKAYFDDPDGPEPSEKLAVHFHCMTDLG